MKNINACNKILANHGIEIVKGNGYFYFVSEYMGIPSICANRISQITESDLKDAIQYEGTHGNK